MRLETLLSKRRAAALRGLPDATDGSAMNHVEWIAVEEGFRLLERDLGKLQVIIVTLCIGLSRPHYACSNLWTSMRRVSAKS